MPLLQVSPAGQGDDKATFLAEFRALRARAGLEYEELAARAHFPTDVLKDAEVGPGLPGLPILTAYVRACGGDVVEWEERWRRLESPVSGTSGLPTRPAGATPAAVAGARASVSVAAADAHDPERIKAALRADQEREEQAARSSLTRAERRLSAGAADPLRTATGPATMIANGSHHKKPWPDALDASSASPGSAASGEPSAPVVPETPAESAVPSASAEEEFDAFRAHPRWQTGAAQTWQASETAASWQAFDTTASSYEDTGSYADAGSCGDTPTGSYENAPTGSRANTSAGSVWSPSGSESSARETIEWRNAFAAEQASDTGTDFTTRARTDFGPGETSFGRSDPGLSRSEPGLSRSEPGLSPSDTGLSRSEPGLSPSDTGLSSAKADRGHAGSDAFRPKAAAPRTAQPTRSTKQRANHPVLLTVLVVLVLIGCIALLVFT